MIAGCAFLATWNNACTNLSPSPTHLDIMVAADTLKNVDLHSEATAFAIIVFPLPGGPNNKIPLKFYLI